MNGRCRHLNASVLLRTLNGNEISGLGYITCKLYIFSDWGYRRDQFNEARCVVDYSLNENDRVHSPCSIG